MKLIHCADLHLDSKLERHLDKEKAKLRRGELIATFQRMIDYAVNNSVEVVLISGDLFDTKNISAAARGCVLSVIKNNPDIRFYYLKGNHDNDNFLMGLEELPGNLRLFNDKWKVYEECDSKINIVGVELSKDNSSTVYDSLVLNSDKYNIVMLHGQESESVAKDKAEVIHLKALRNKGIDYLALGHVHAYKRADLDARATYCYPGCLEGRGFDECGEHGFVLLDYDENTNQCAKTFVPFAKRKIYEVNVDVSDCQTTADMITKTKSDLASVGCTSVDMVRIVLTGTVDVECDKDIEYLITHFKEDYYFVKCIDSTRLEIKIDDYILDQSLKGEFVRQVMEASDLSEEDKRIVIRYGLQAISGEEVQ